MSYILIKVNFSEKYGIIPRKVEIFVDPGGLFSTDSVQWRSQGGGGALQAKATPKKIICKIRFRWSM